MALLDQLGDGPDGVFDGDVRVEARRAVDVDDVDASALLATVPALVAGHIRRTRPHLRTRPLPFSLPGTALELLWSADDDDDPAGRFVRDQIVALSARADRAKPR